ncbi:MAG: hypothetical protein ACI8P3_002255 [Saprospiraceae bacterium]|jgi:hypothetical protein
MNAPVNIVYPIQGHAYPISDPMGVNLQSAYLTFSFSVTKSGGAYDVEWGVDNQTLGNTTYCDMFSAQFVWKLPGGKHEFWVKGDSGSDSVMFTV